MSKVKVAVSLIVVALLVCFVTGCGDDAKEKVEAFLMGVALEGTWKTGCEERSGDYLSYSTDVTFSSALEGPKTFTLTLQQWTQANCEPFASPDDTRSFPGTYVLGDEVDCLSGYDGVCVQLDLLYDTYDDEYTIFSIDPDKTPDVLYLPQGDTDSNNRPVDVDVAETETTYIRQQ